jgi:hypothetical protein
MRSPPQGDLDQRRRTSWTSWRPRALVTLADKGYQGSTWAKIPYKGKNKPESQKQANKAHAKLRAPGEHANAQVKTAQDL